jgi:hypothetical protein
MIQDGHLDERHDEGLADDLAGTDRTVTPTIGVSL